MFPSGLNSDYGPSSPAYLLTGLFRLFYLIQAFDRDFIKDIHTLVEMVVVDDLTKVLPFQL